MSYGLSSGCCVGVLCELELGGLVARTRSPMTIRISQFRLAFLVTSVERPGGQSN